MSATNYHRAAATVAEALALLDDNPDFGQARDSDPNWPADAERAAVLALRTFRDRLTPGEDRSRDAARARALITSALTATPVPNVGDTLTLTLHTPDPESPTYTTFRIHGHLDQAAQLHFDSTDLPAMVATLTSVLARDETHAVLTSEVPNHEHGTPSWERLLRLWHLTPGYTSLTQAEAEALIPHLHVRYSFPPPSPALSDTEPTHTPPHLATALTTH